MLRYSGGRIRLPGLHLCAMSSRLGMQMLKRRHRLCQRALIDFGRILVMDSDRTAMIHRHFCAHFDVVFDRRISGVNPKGLTLCLQRY